MKDFDSWNNIKKEIDAKSPQLDFFFYEREIWWCSIGVNIGVEADGKNIDFERPILILKKFNGLMFWGLPLVSGRREGQFYYPINWPVETSIVLSQLRIMSSKRLLRKVETISEIDFDMIKSKLRTFI